MEFVVKVLRRNLAGVFLDEKRVLWIEEKSCNRCRWKAAGPCGGACRQIV